MIVKELYCFEREEGKVTVSTEKPDCEYSLRFRLIAEEGEELTKDGENFTTCIDVDDIEGWNAVLKNVSGKPALAPDEISPEEFMMLVEEAL